MSRTDEDSGSVYAPNLSDEDLPSGGACFLDQTRVCGPDCVAFLTKPPEGQAYLGENWSRCHLLVNADRVGRHLVITAKVLGDNLQIKRNEAADNARRHQPQPPKVK